MTIERCTQYRRIKRLANVHYPETLGPWPLVVSSEFYYLIEVEDEKDLGFWIFHPRSEDDKLQFHAAMGPECKGKKAIASAKQAFDWIFDNTGYNAIIGETPQDIKPAWMMAAKAGMEYQFTDDFGLRTYIIRRES